MAVEGGLKTPTGELYNDIPDRFSDLFFFVGASLSIPFAWGIHLGWAAAVFAILTAYVRVLGASMQKGHDFGGPTAKQHRMFLLNIAVFAAAAEKSATGQVRYSLAVGVAVILLGSLLTVMARIFRLAKKL
jgi:phosphatidylglycerophosphate synthase